MRVQELAARIKEAGWPGDPVRFAATLVDEITDPRHGVVTSEQLGSEAAAINPRITHEVGSLSDRLTRETASMNARLTQEVALLREEMRGIETRLELRIEKAPAPAGPADHCRAGGLRHAAGPARRTGTAGRRQWPAAPSTA